MAKKSYNEIRSINEDWSFDDRNGFMYSGDSVQKFLKEQLLSLISQMGGKFGDARFEDGSMVFYDEDGGTRLATVPLTGSTYAIDIETETPSTFYCLVGEENKIITILPSTREGSIGSGEMHDYPENYTWTMAVDNGAGFVVRATGECVDDNPFSVNIRPFVTVGSNKVRITITGNESKQTRSVIFTCTVTTLALSVNHQWNKPWLQTANYAIEGITFTGSIQKTLHVRIDDDELQHYSQTFAASVSYVTNLYQFDMTDKFPDTTGVHKIDVWMDGEGVETEHTIYRIICVAQGDETSARLVCVNQAQKEAMNYASQDLFRFATYNVAEVRVVVTGNDGEYDYPVVDIRLNDIQAEVKNTFATRVEIETEVMQGVTLNVQVIAEEGNTESLQMAVNNKNSFPAVTGADFYMSAASRSNSEPMSDRTKIFNIAKGATTTEYPATMTNFAWENDGWTVDDTNTKTFAVSAGNTVTAQGIKPLSILQTDSFTLEWKHKVTAVSDYDTPIMSIMDTAVFDSERTNGVILFPTRILVLSNSSRNLTQQSVNLCEDEELHCMIVWQRNYNNTGHNLCRIYVNGMPQCTFEYGGSASFGNGYLTMGQSSADFYLYMMRWYNGTAFETQNILANFLNTINESTGKSREGIAKDNDVVDGNSISYDMCKKAGFNCMVIETGNGLIPDLDHTTKFSNTKMSIEYADSPEKNFTIEGAPLDGQGTTSMKYYRWNLRWKCSDSTIWKYPNARTSQTTKSGWFDGENNHPKVSKITAKKNVASSSQGHKMGATALYNDLYKRILKDDTDVPADARVAIYSYPVVGFVKNGDEYRYIGLYTIGPDKGDSKTFGYDKKDFPKFLSLEGPNHAPLGTRFIHPWNEDVAFSSSDETATFGGEEGWDVDACPYETSEANDNAAILQLLVEEWKPAYDLACYCSPYLRSLDDLGMTLEQINANVIAFRNSMDVLGNRKNEVLTIYDTEYRLVYYRNKTGRYEVLANHNVLDYVSDYLDGVTSPDTAQLIAAREAKFRAEAGNYFNVSSATFHACYRFLTGASDNDAKNTYPFKLKPLSDGGRWEWRGDDLDTILATDNNGNSSKEYYVEPGDVTADGVDIFQGSSSVFWTLLERVFPMSGKGMMMDKVCNAMSEIAAEHNVAGSYLWESTFNAFDYYFWEHSANYFPATLYNEDAIFTYISVWQKDPNADYNGVRPLTQALGTQYEAEKQWVSRRIIYTMSKYQIGGFDGSSDDGLGSLEFTPVENFVFKVKPTIDMYPSASKGGGGNVNGVRTKAGEECMLLAESDGQTTFYVKAMDWLRSLGDLSGLLLTSRGVTSTINFSVSSKRMKELIVGNADASRVKFNATGLSVAGESMEVVDARNVTSLIGEVRLLDTPRLRRALFAGSTASGLMLPVGAKIQEVSMPSKMTSLFLHTLPFLTEDKLSIPEEAYKEITNLYIANCQNIDIFSIIRKAKNAEGSKMRFLNATWNTPLTGVSTDIDILSELTTPYNAETQTGYGRSTYDAETKTIGQSAEKPILQGVINVEGGAYQDAVDRIKAYFGGLTINLSKIYIRFADAEVQRVLMANGVGDGTGITKEEMANVTDIGTFQNCWFNGNSSVETLDDLKYCPNLYIGSSWFRNMTNLKSISLEGDKEFDYVVPFDYDKNLEVIRVNGVMKLSSRNVFGTSVNVSLHPDTESGTQNLKRIVANKIIIEEDGCHSIFEFCKNLQELPTIKIYGNVLGHSMFYYCEKLKHIEFEGDIYIIESNCFYNCGIESIDLSKVTSIGGNAFMGSKIKIVDCPATTIGGSVFQGCSELLKAYLPNIITCPSWANEFYLCTKLEYVFLPKLEFIAEGMFMDCTALKRIVVPSCKKIGYRSIETVNNDLVLDVGKNAESLNGLFTGANNCTLIVRSTIPPECSFGSYPFRIFVPASSIDAYKSANGFSSISNRIYAIGGSEWTNIFGSSSIFADFADDEKYDELVTVFNETGITE